MPGSAPLFPSGGIIIGPDYESIQSIAQDDVLAYIKDIQADIMSKVEDLQWDLPTDMPEIGDVEIPTFTPGEIDFTYLYDLLQSLLAELPSDPVFLPVDTNTATIGTLKTIPDIANIPIPEFTGSVPTVNFGDSPVWTDPGTMATEPSVNTYEVPSKPSYAMPSEPSLSSVNLPSPATVDIPIFDATLLDEDLITPTNNFVFNESDYSSLLKDAVYAKLLDEIDNGGYGLDANDEQLLFDREREREFIAVNGVTNEATKLFTSNGFSMPQGALLKTLRIANQDFLNKTSSVNRDIALKRADLYMQGKQFDIQQAITLEGLLINLHNARKERELNAAKAMIQVAIDIFNAEITRYKAKQERYIALTEVFKARVQAELAKVEIYKAQMDGAKTEVAINQNLVDLYKARVSVISTIMDVYKIDATVFEILNNSEKIKFDIFRAQIDAYIAKINAKKIEFEAYDSKVRGELGKVEVYKAEAVAYSAVIDGKKSAIQAEATKLSAYVEQNRGIIEAFKAEVEQYKSIREMAKDYNEDQAVIYKTKGEVITSEIAAVSKIADAYVSATEAEYKMATLAVQVSVDIAKLELEQAIKIAEFYTEAMKSKSDFYRSYIASVMSIMNFNSSLSASSSSSVSDSTAQSLSDNYSTYTETGAIGVTHTNINHNLTS